MINDESKRKLREMKLDEFIDILEIQQKDVSIPKKMVDIIAIQADSNNLQKGYKVVLDNDKIIIKVNTTIKDDYDNYGRLFLPVILSSLLVPAMQEVLCAMRNIEVYQDRKWYDVIAKRLEDLGILEDEIAFLSMETLGDEGAQLKKSIPHIAQAIFKYPLEECLKSLVNVGDSHGSQN